MDTLAHTLYGPKTAGTWGSPTALIGPTGPIGPQGITGLNGNTLLSGAAAPTVLDGTDGDYFMDTLLHNLYGPKTAGTWGNPTALIGPTGPTGPQGINGLNGNTLLSGATAPTVLDGLDGDYFMDTVAHHLYGPKTFGAWGCPTSLIGPSGPTGPAGSDAQVASTWADIATLKTQGLLIPGFVYKITDLQNIELVAKTTNTFHRIPYKEPFKELNMMMNYLILIQKYLPVLITLAVQLDVVTEYAP